MEKVEIKINQEKREIKIYLPVSPFMEKEVKELVSIACTQNVAFSYDPFQLVFCVNAHSAETLQKLREEYEKYFFVK